METLTITRVLSGRRRGSSRPIVVNTDRGRHLVKLRGAAQGPGALIAEIIVAQLGEALELPVLPRRLALLSSTTPTDDHDDELADLLEAGMPRLLPDCPVRLSRRPLRSSPRRFADKCWGDERPMTTPFAVVVRRMLRSYGSDSSCRAPSRRHRRFSWPERRGLRRSG